MATSNDTTQIPYGYCHCGCGQKTSIATRNVHSRGIVKGEPNPYIHAHSSNNQEITRRFWSKVDKVSHPDGCWLFTGTLNKLGYGVILRNKKRVMAHRLSWELTNGEIPDGLYVCHKCDNPTCVRPEHLFIGTQQDNVTDMMNKGRNADVEKTRRRGEKHGMHKLTRLQVEEIRQRFNAGGISKAQLGREYGVTDVQIYHIVTYKAWRY